MSIFKKTTDLKDPVAPSKAPPPPSKHLCYYYIAVVIPFGAAAPLQHKKVGGGTADHVMF